MFSTLLKFGRPFRRGDRGKFYHCLQGGTVKETMDKCFQGLRERMSAWSYKVALVKSQHGHDGPNGHLLCSNYSMNL